MTTADLSCESAWTVKFGGTEQYAGVPFAPDSPLAGERLTVMVVCDRQPFTQRDRDHAQLRWQGLRRNLQPALDRMMRHLAVADRRDFLDQYGTPTVMLTAGDYESWSLSFERRSGPAASVFCDWCNDDIGEVWVAD